MQPSITGYELFPAGPKRERGMRLCDVDDEYIEQCLRDGYWHDQHAPIFRAELDRRLKLKQQQQAESPVYNTFAAAEGFTPFTVSMPVNEALPPATPGAVAVANGKRTESKALQLNLPVDVHRKLKARAATEGTTLSSMLLHALQLAYPEVI